MTPLSRRSYRIMVLTVLLLLLPLMTGLLSAQGSEFRTGDEIRISATDTLHRQLVAFGSNIDIRGHLENDLIAAGETVTLSGSIVDDAILAAETVNLNGRVGDMLLAAASFMTLDGLVGGDMAAAGRELRILPGSTVGGNLFLAAETVRIEGAEIIGHARIAAGTVHLDARFSDHVDLYSSRVTFGPGYQAIGETRINSYSPIYREQLGSIPERLFIEIRQRSPLPALLFQIWFYLAMLATGLLILLLFQPQAADLRSFAASQFWRNLGTGALLFFTAPMILLILTIPLITIPLAGVAAITWGLALFLGYLFVCLMLGLQVIGWFRKEDFTTIHYAGFALGLLLMAMITTIPVIGPLMSLLLILYGFGCVIRWSASKYRSMRDRHRASING